MKDCRVCTNLFSRIEGPFSSSYSSSASFPSSSSSSLRTHKLKHPKAANNEPSAQAVGMREAIVFNETPELPLKWKRFPSSAGPGLHVACLPPPETPTYHLTSSPNVLTKERPLALVAIRWPLWGARLRDTGAPGLQVLKPPSLDDSSSLHVSRSPGLQVCKSTRLQASKPQRVKS